jgi:hypothetical protein
MWCFGHNNSRKIDQNEMNLDQASLKFIILILNI